MLCDGALGVRLSRCALRDVFPGNMKPSVMLKDSFMEKMDLI